MAERVIDRQVVEYGARTDRASIQRARVSLDSLRQGMNRLALQAGIAGAALTAATVGVVKNFANVQTEFAKIEGLVGISRDVIDKQLAPAIDNVALKFGVLPSVAAKAAFFITSAGQRGAAALDTLQWSSRGFAAQLGEVPVLAKLATSAQNAYGKENLSNAQIFDQLAMAVRRGTFETDAIGAVMGRLMPLASNLGIEFHEVAGSLAAMSLTGTEADEAATQLNQIMATILNPSSEAEKVINGLGMTIADLKNQVADSGLIATVKMLKESLSDEQFTMLFGNMRALKGVTDLFGENYSVTKDILADVAAAFGTTDEAMEAQSRTINFQLNKAHAAMQVGLLKIGAAMAPVVGQILDRFIPALGTMIEKFEELPPWMKQAVGWSVLLGPALLLVAFSLPIISAALGVMGTALGAVSLPVIVVGVALALLAWGAAYLWGPQITDAWEAVKAAFIDPVIAEIKRQFSGPSWETLKAAWEAKSLDPVIAEVFPELDDTDATWNEIGAAILDRLITIGKFTAVLLFPELDETDITWNAVGEALKNRIIGLGTLALILLFPELDITDITWSAVWSALRKRITLHANNFMVMLFPELDETDITWSAVWSALRKRITLHANNFMVMLFPELDETDITWNTVKEAVKDRITGIASSLIAWIVPKFGLSEEKAAEIQKEWNDWVAKYISFDVDVKFGVLQAFISFWEKFRESLDEEGFSESATALIGSLAGLMGSLVNFGTTVADSLGFDNVTEFLVSLGALAGSGLAGAIVEIADSITVFTTALQWFVDNITLSTSGWIAFFQALSGSTNPLTGQTLAEEEAAASGEVDQQKVTTSAGDVGRTIHDSDLAENLREADRKFEQYMSESDKRQAKLREKYSSLPPWMIPQETGYLEAAKLAGGAVVQTVTDSIRNKPVTSGTYPAKQSQEPSWIESMWSRWVTGEEGNSEGGFTMRDGLAFLHKGEGIFPLDRMNEVMASYAQLQPMPAGMMAGGGGGPNITVGDFNITIQSQPGMDEERLARLAGSQVRQQWRDMVDTLDSPLLR